MDHMFNGTFAAAGADVNWVPEGMCREIIKACKVEQTLLIAGDGVFSLLENNDIKLVDLKTNITTTVVSLFDIRDVSDPNTSSDIW